MGAPSPRPSLDRFLAPSTARRKGTSQHVIEVVDSGGMHGFAKQVGDQRSWRVEVRAYRHWAPALGNRAPTLRASSANLRTLLLSALPGQPPLRTDARAYRKAGVLLRQLHESRPARMQQPSDLGRTSLRLERLLARRPGLFTPAEVSFVRSHANRINDLRLDKKVPCHGDYTSQNWLVDAFDTLRVSTSEHRGGPSRPPTSRSCSSARGGGVPTWRLCSSRATAVRSRSTSWSSSDCAWRPTRFRASSSVTSEELTSIRTTEEPASPTS